MAAGQAELEASRPRIFSIGHSTHELDELVGLLRAHGVEAVADVRRHPASRRLPWFKREVLSRKLVREGLSYRHVPELGGRRRPDRDSPNAGWRVEGFRGYADHMAGPEFAAGLDALVELASRQTTAMMCAEGLWWRCHRRLIADALAVRHWQVVHIDPTGGAAPHELTSFAVADGERLTYPPAQAALDC